MTTRSITSTGSLTTAPEQRATTMYTTCATRRITKVLASGMACLLVAAFCVALWAASAEGSVGGYLYLLAGTPTPDSASGFPVRLYTVAGTRLALVRQVAAGLFSVADDLSRHLYVLGLGLRALSVIHENAPGEIDVVPAPPQPKGRFASFSFYYPTWGAISGPGVSPSAVFADWTDHWTVTRIYAHAPRGKLRIARGSWDLYRYFRYQGPGGGPRRQLTIPGGTIEDGRIMMPYTLAAGVGYVGPTPPFLPPKAGAVAGYPDRPRGAGIIADTARFFALNAPPPAAELRGPRTVYVLNKVTGHWSVIEVPFYGLWPRLFGAWLATTVQEPNPTGRESPGLKNERANEVNATTPTGVVRELPRIRGMYGTKTYMPGKLLLQNLVDGHQRLFVPSLDHESVSQQLEVANLRADVATFNC